MARGQSPDDEIAAYRAAIQANRREWVWATGPDLRLAFVSAEFRQVTGLDPAGEIGRRLGAELRFLSHEERMQFEVSLALRGPFFDLSVQVPLLDGALRWVRLSGLPFAGAEGRFAGYRGIARDVTPEMRDRLQATTTADALREESRRAQAILDTAIGLIALLGWDGTMIQANRALREALGLEEAALRGREIADVLRDAGQSRAAAAIEAALDGLDDEPLRTLDLPLDRDGFPRPHEVTLRAIGRAGEAGAYIILEGRDVTARRAMEARNRRLEMELMQAQKMDSLGTLAGGVAHEINTPVQYVGDNIRFLREAFGHLAAAMGGDAADAEARFALAEAPRAIAEAEEGIERIAQIVAAIRDFSHPDQATHQPADLGALIRSTATVARHHWRMVARLEIDIEPGLPPLPCHAGRINQVLLNLIVNAAQAIEEANRAAPGVIRVMAWQDGGEVVVSVADDGAGIAPENLARIWDLFFTTKAPGRGTGQGLAITHGIVTRDHGGSIAVASRPGEGATFTLRLPLVPMRVAA